MAAHYYSVATYASHTPTSEFPISLEHAATWHLMSTEDSTLYLALPRITRLLESCKYLG
jgi:hypothetical protein